MRRLTKVLLIGATVAGITGVALAASPAVHEMPAVHVMTVALPNGGTAQIRYLGDVPPQINFVQRPVTMTAFGPGFAAPSPFAEMARMQALMDRQMAAMMLQARQMQRAAMTDPLYQAALKDKPSVPGGTHFISTKSGNNYCFRSVQITAAPNGGAPNVVTHTEGNCGASPSPQTKPSSVTTAPRGTAVPLQTISFTPQRNAPRPHPGI